jgi:hypothetical protein
MHLVGTAAAQRIDPIQAIPRRVSVSEEPGTVQPRAGGFRTVTRNTGSAVVVIARRVVVTSGVIVADGVVVACGVVVAHRIVVIVAHRIVVIVACIVIASLFSNTVPRFDIADVAIESVASGRHVRVALHERRVHQLAGASDQQCSRENK